MLKLLKIADIKVGSRHRKDMGDLTSLAESIRQEGLLQSSFNDVDLENKSPVEGSKGYCKHRK